MAVARRYDFVVPPGGRLSVGQVHSAIVPASTVDHAVVDLRLAQWVEPIGLVAVAAFAEMETLRGRRVVLRAPQRPDVARYLSRMRLGLALQNLDQEHDLPAVHEWNSGSRLVELRRFIGADEPDELGRMLFNRTASLPPMANALHQCVAELGANVPEHSGEDWGYVAAQTTYGDTVVQFAVGDAGNGVAASFTPNCALTDEEALHLTLQRGVSRTGMPGHGQGLKKVRQLMADLQGNVHMVSGTAHRTTYRRATASGSATHGYQGTLLQGTFPVPTGERAGRR